MEPYYAGVLSILPPIIAVGLALITKEVFSSLLIGILSGTLIYTVGIGDGNIVIGTVENAFKVMGSRFDLNIVIFCSLLGSLVYVISTRLRQMGNKPHQKQKICYALYLYFRRLHLHR